MAMNRRASASGALVVPALLPRFVAGTRVHVQMQRISKGVNQESLIAALNLVGRVLLVAIFLPEAWVKLRGYDNVLEYMEQYGVPGVLLPLVIAVEIAAPVMIILGWYTRLAAFVLAGFCLLTALFFHTDFDDLNQVLHFWKNLAMAGGFIVVMANGAGAWSLDARTGKRNTATPTS
ncbi:MAG: DoxX family protein [Xanthobacteraceae bacterium]